jgi:hypothetical protein
MVGFSPEGSLGLSIQNEQWGAMISSFVRFYTRSILETYGDLVLTATFSHHEADTYNARPFLLLQPFPVFLCDKRL